MAGLRFLLPSVFVQEVSVSLSKAVASDLKSDLKNVISVTGSMTSMIAVASVVAILATAVGCGGSSSSGGPAGPPPIKNPKPRDKRSAVVVAGDSLAVGTGATAANWKIENCLRRELGLQAVFTLAADGNSTRDTEALFAGLAAAKPRVVVLSLGGNDVLMAAAGESFPAQETFDNLRAFYRKLTDKGVLVIQLGLNPPVPEAARLAQIADVAAAEGVMYVPDILNGLWKDSRYMTDAVHPNDAGYAKVCERVVEAMKPIYLKD